MRPRVFPAEDAGRLERLLAHRLCFNEAAGIPRGRRHHAADDTHGTRASMRPRVFPAEDAAPAWRSRPRRFRFNEAAGIPRGRRRAACFGLGSMSSFNEAAGIPRGRQAATAQATGMRALLLQ